MGPFLHIRTASGIHSRFYTVWKTLTGEGEINENNFKEE
jgi:hypothetical protein